MFVGHFLEKIRKNRTIFSRMSQTSSARQIDGSEIVSQLDRGLAPFAQKNADSRGREFPEKTDPRRGSFQRDRDRILHATAFRRLAGKMQVVSPARGDHFRNRLTHTLEVAQLSRDLARELLLNEDLAEAIALAHDLGHPPFGHAGERTLHEKMKKFGKKFEHNAQSLRVVDFFENRYRDFPGLNLTFEVREGLKKHSTFFDHPETGDQIFAPHIEAQLVDVADEISYLSADLEDGLRGNFFQISDLKNIALPAEILSELSTPKSRSALIRGTIRKLFGELVFATRKNLKTHKIETQEDVQKCSEKLVMFSPDFFEKFRELKQFLMQNFYLSPEVKSGTDRGQKILSDIFDFLHAHPDQLPEYLKSSAEPLEIRICDYIAGMTDRYAERFWKQIDS